MTERAAVLPPPPWESRVRQVLRREIEIGEAIRLPPADRTEGYDPEVFRADLRLLNNLNDIYCRTKSWRLVEFSMGILGGEGRILHLPPGYDWEMYAVAAEDEGRLLTPTELRQKMEEDDFFVVDLDVDLEEEDLPDELKVLKERRTAVVEVVPDEGAGVEAEGPRPMGPLEPPRPGSVEEGEYLLPTKALGLGRAAGYGYRDVCGEEGRALDVKEYCEYVCSRSDVYELRRECRLQLNMELQTVDEVLMRLERSRDEEERKVLVLDIMDQDVKYHIVKGQRLYSRAYIEAYPDKFPLEEISRFNTKLKCESDCLSCINFVYTLVKPGPRIIRLS